jgi:hypothetical protein
MPQERSHFEVKIPREGKTPVTPLQQRPATRHLTRRQSGLAVWSGGPAIAASVPPCLVESTAPVSLSDLIASVLPCRSARLDQGFLRPGWPSARHGPAERAPGIQIRPFGPCAVDDDRASSHGCGQACFHCGIHARSREPCDLGSI